jgi:hypothetical protein
MEKMEKLFNKLNNIPHDKALHFIGGILLFIVGNLLNSILGLMLVFTFAISKEIYDYLHKDNHTPDFFDALATCLGGLVGFFCAATTIYRLTCF